MSPLAFLVPRSVLAPDSMSVVNMMRLPVLTRVGDGTDADADAAADDDDADDADDAAAM